MNYTSVISAIILSSCLLCASFVQAAENNGSTPTGHGGEVLGQPATDGKTGTAGASQGDSQTQDKKEKQPEDKGEDIQKIFEQSLRQMMPLSDDQIRQYRDWSDKRDRALLPMSPTLKSRTVRVSLEPGQAPMTVKTTANVATSLLFHDSTGQPWPVSSVTNGSPTAFQVLRPELPDSNNLLNVVPTQSHGVTTLVVSLEKNDVPLVIRLESDSVRGAERRADALVLFQIAHQGPRANIPLVTDVKETASSTLLAFLDQVPPKEAVRVSSNPALDATTQVWKIEDTHYIRTKQMLIWPAWAAVVNGAGDVKCYEAPATSRLLLSIDGKVKSFTLRDFPVNTRNTERQVQ